MQKSSSVKRIKTSVEKLQTEVRPVKPFQTIEPNGGAEKAQTNQKAVETLSAKRILF